MAEKKEFPQPPLAGSHRKFPFPAAVTRDSAPGTSESLLILPPVASATAPFLISPACLQGCGVVPAVPTPSRAATATLHASPAVPLAPSRPGASSSSVESAYGSFCAFSLSNVLRKYSSWKLRESGDDGSQVEVSIGGSSSPPSAAPAGLPAVSASRPAVCCPTPPPAAAGGGEGTVFSPLPAAAGSGQQPSAAAAGPPADPASLLPEPGIAAGK